MLSRISCGLIHVYTGTLDSGVVILHNNDHLPIHVTVNYGDLASIMRIKITNNYEYIFHEHISDELF